jgi:hypothetical protein
MIKCPKYEWRPNYISTVKYKKREQEHFSKFVFVLCPRVIVVFVWRSFCRSSSSYIYAAGYHFLCLFVFKTNKQKRDKPISIYVEQHSSCRVVASENCRRGNAGRGGREFPPPHRCAITGKAACMFGVVLLTFTYTYYPWRVGYGLCVGGV